ncbi:hypothetical protein GCM10009663_40160 [Kitasatospora arboriphila]|uniref:Uncharacterized protein n=1 Tax=Kitasatospora arboriphila TaxID=258052 RepID=A0ABN1TMH4_9ACTN
MRDALDAFEATPAVGRPGGYDGVAWKATEDIPHTGISVDVALGHNGSLADRTGGLA